MRTDTFKGRDFLTLLDWTQEEVGKFWTWPCNSSRTGAIGRYHDELLRAKTLFMLFYNQSLRTRNSFEAGMHNSVGTRTFWTPTKSTRRPWKAKEVAYSTERVSDVARVLSRMGEAIAIRCYGDPVDWEYGGANALLHEFARWSDAPILNMEDDKYHPFQALADLLTVKEKFGSFKGVKFVMSWAYSPSAPQAPCGAAKRHHCRDHDGLRNRPGASAGDGVGPRNHRSLQKERRNEWLQL